MSSPVIPSSEQELTEAEDHAKEHDHPEILPISQGSYTSEEELKEVKGVSESPVTDKTTDSIVIKKEEVERRRLSYRPMEESSGSELTPSPQPQRRRLKVNMTSSSSEDLQADSPDSSVDDEEFIRRQIMGMTGAEEEMSLSEDEEEFRKEDTTTEKTLELDNIPKTAEPLPEKDNAGIPARRPSLPKPEDPTTEERLETETTIVFKKAIPRMRQRQSTDEVDAEVESITESLDDKSKGDGSSSVQVSSFTPGASPTSASSLEEDSDSSPSHRRAGGEGKLHRKAKHRQAGQALPTIEDSSEEEEMREEEEHLREHENQREGDLKPEKRSSKKSKREKDELRTQRRKENQLTSPSNL